MLITKIGEKQNIVVHLQNINIKDSQIIHRMNIV
jgi:hypothetical protein